VGREKKVFIVTKLNGGYQVRYYVLLLDVMDFEQGGSFLLGAKNGRGVLRMKGKKKKKKIPHSPLLLFCKDFSGVPPKEVNIIVRSLLFLLVAAQV